MPLCGFNNKMIEGIELFSEGLFEATMERGQQNGVTAHSAVESEVREIQLFVSALQQKYGTPEQTPKKMAQMIFGIAVFASGLFESTLAQEKLSSSDLQPQFSQQVRKIGKFLEALESKHQELKKTNTAEQTMIKAVEWIHQNDV